MFWKSNARRLLTKMFAAPAASRLRRRATSATAKFRPQVEGLGERTMPAVYDPASAFSASSNTSGPWSYGSADTLTGAFIPGGSVNIASGIDTWGVSTLPGVFHNPSSGDVTFATTVTMHGGEIALHPGPQGQYAAVQFTAPADGDYQIDASFAGRDSGFGGTDAHILVNGSEVFGATVTNNSGVGMGAPATVHLTTGDKVDFRVGFGPNGNYYNDSTNLTATITQNDEDDSPPPPADDAAGSFSALQNSNNGWSFGWSPTETGTFIPGSAFAMAPGVAGWGDTSIWDQLPGAFKNVTNQSQTFRNTVTLGAGELALHPGVGNEYAVAEYTAAVAGNYAITGSFAGRDNAFGGTDAHIQVNGVEVFGAAVTDNTGTGMYGPLTVHLNAGDTVDYRVGYGSNGTYYNDSTALDASVTLVEADPVISVTATDTSEGSATGGFTFTRTGDVSQSLTVHFTVDGEATEGSDYAPISRTVTFDAGETAATLPINAVDDAEFELPEYVVVRIEENASYATSSDYAAGVRINDNEVGSIAGVVWHDLDEDGLLTTADAPLAGVSVTLRDSLGNELGSSVTDGYGAYLFAGLAGGTYVVDFNQPYGFVFTAAGVGSDEALDSDADPFTTWSEPVTLAGYTLSATVSAGLILTTFPPQPAETKVEIVDSRGNEFAPGKIRVAKWSEAFTADGQTVKLADPVEGLDFIDRDQDNFRVRVYDLARWTDDAASVDVTLKTLNAAVNVINDAPTTIRLVKDAARGWYVSDTMILVSSTDDDTFAAPPGQEKRYGADEAGPDNTKTYAKGGVTWWTTDRTHRIKLGETVSVEYTSPGDPVTHTASVKADPQKVVKMYINVMNNKKAADGGTPALARVDVERDVTRMNEMFARVGIRVEAEINVGADPLAGLVDLTDGLAPREKVKVVRRGLAAAQYMEVVPSFEQTALLGDAKLFKKLPGDQFAKDTSYIHVYYVPSFTGDATIGESIPSALYTGPGATGIADTVMISAKERNYGTLAHEVIHVLENFNVPEATNAKGIDITHFPNNRPNGTFDTIHTTNLMVTGAGTKRPAITTIYDSIRLTLEQQTRVYAREALVKDPG